MRVLTDHARRHCALPVINDIGFGNAAAVGDHDQRCGQFVLHAVHFILHLPRWSALPGLNTGTDPAISRRGCGPAGKFLGQCTVVNDITQFGQSGFGSLQSDSTKAALLRNMNMADRRRVRA